MLFRRKPAPDPVTAFWAWWAREGRKAAERGIAGGDWGTFPDDITDRVQDVHPDLEWELSRGASSEHALIVSGAGLQAGRRAAERWLRQAPRVDDTWEHHPARQPDLPLTNTLEIAEHALDLSLVRFAIVVDGERRRVDTTVVHPGFAAMPAEASAQAAFLVLDWVLGEDGVTRWLGGVSSEAQADVVVGVEGLLAAVDQLSAGDGEDSWALLRGGPDDRPTIAVVDRSAKWIDHPLLDGHLGVVLPFADQTPEGLPGPSALDQLRAVEDSLGEWLGVRGRLVAHETSAGSRLLHAYVDTDDPGAQDVARSVVRGWPGAEVTVDADPGWQRVGHLL